MEPAHEECIFTIRLTNGEIIFDSGVRVIFNKEENVDLITYRTRFDELVKLLSSIPHPHSIKIPTSNFIATSRHFEFLFHQDKDMSIEQFYRDIGACPSHTEPTPIKSCKCHCVLYRHPDSNEPIGFNFYLTEIVIGDKARRIDNAIDEFNSIIASFKDGVKIKDGELETKE
jgi:hypothetical protein